MITFSLSGASGLLCRSGSVALDVFPSGKVAEGCTALLSVPEEVPSKGVISWPGEYDIGGASIHGIGQKEGQQVSYVVEVDGVRCAFLSSPLQDWTDYELQLLGDTDVLVVSAEKPKVLQKIVEEVDPRMVVIMPVDGKIEAGVVAACGGEGVEPTKEFKLKGSLPQEGRQVVVLQG